MPLLTAGLGAQARYTQHPFVLSGKSAGRQLGHYLGECRPAADCAA